MMPWAQAMLHLRRVVPQPRSTSSEQACPLSWRGTRLIPQGRRGEQPKEMGRTDKEHLGHVIVGTPSENMQGHLGPAGVVPACTHCSDFAVMDTVPLKISSYVSA